jgi:Tfp pilus assembly protein PilF
MGLATLLYLGGLFSKESSVAFAVIFPLTYLLVKPGSIGRGFKMLAPISLAAGIFLLARHFALQGIVQENETTILENVLYGAQDPGTLWATKAGILWHFLKLLFVPYPLSWDYSFNQIPLQTWSDALPWISVTAYLLLGVLTFINIRKYPGITFGILFFGILISPTSNILFFNGTTFADRFLFLPSAGFLLAATLLGLRLASVNTEKDPKAGSRYFYPFATGLMLVFALMSFSRAGDWEDNLAVFRSGAANAPNSSRTNLGLGTQYMNIAEKQTDFRTRNAYVDSAVTCFEKSLAIYPDNYAASYRLGLIYSIQNRNDRAIALYRQSIAAKSDNLLALNNLGALYASANKLDSALWCFEESIRLDSLNSMTLTNLVIVNNLKGRNEQALRIGEKAIALGMGNEKIYRILEPMYISIGDSIGAMQMRNLLQVQSK